MIAGGDAEQAAGGRGGGFDVFLSHNGRDKPLVERIAEQLRRTGVRPFLDAWDLTPGGSWQHELVEGLSRSRACAVFVGPQAFGQWQLEELELALVQANQRDDFRIFAVLLPGVEDPFDAQRLPPFLSTRTWVDLRGGTDSRQALQRLLNAIAGVAPGPATPAQPIGGIVPYRGLEPFEEEHAELFFGRERDLQRLLEILKASPLLCVVGPSGSGKSSLVRAGLIPRLRHGALPGVEDCEVCVLRPGAHPLQALATQLAPLGTGKAMQATLDDLASDRRTLHLAVSLALGADRPGRRVVIVVDQLEEVFTLCSDEREREQFFANLLHAASVRGGQTIVVLTMRADFYGRCAAYPELAQRTARSLALIGPMDPDELRQAIEQPARRTGLFFESGLVQTILDDVGHDSGALPLLEHALLEVWHRRVGDQLTLDGYVQAGRVEGALTQRAESVFSGFTTDQQQIARRLLLRLTEPGEGSEDTRRRASIDELRPTEADDGDSFDEVLGRLVDARLLTTGRDETGQDVVDVSHEALIRGWPRLQRWIDTDRAGLLTHRRLTDAALEWNLLNRDPASLYRGTRLTTATEWATDHDDDLNRLEVEFLTASKIAHERERLSQKRRTKLVWSAVTTVLVASVAVVIATWFASRERAIATSRDIATQSAALIDTDPVLALALAREAIERHGTAQAQNALRQATFADRATAISPSSTGDVYVADPSPDGRHVVTSGDDGTVRLWRLDPLRLERTLVKHQPGASRAAFDSGGRFVASASIDGKVVVSAIGGDTPRTVLRLAGGDGEHGISVDAARRMLVVGTSAGAVRLVPTRAGGKAYVLGRHATPTTSVFAVAIDATGTKVVSGGDDGRAYIWDVATRTSIALPHRGEPVYGASFSHDGRRVATAGHSGRVRLWDTSTGEAVGAPLTVDDQALWSVRFSRDDRRLVTAGEDGVVRISDIRGGQLVSEMAGGSARAADFVSSSNTIVSAGRRGTLDTWSPPTVRVARASGTIPFFSRDGRHVVSGGERGQVHLWELARGERRLPGHGEASVTAFSPDGSKVVSASYDSSVRLYNIRSRRSRKLRFPTFPKYAVAMNDAGRIAVGGDADAILIQDANGANSVKLLHEPTVFALAVSPDGSRLVSASEDGTARIWNLHTGAAQRVIRADTVAVRSVSFSHDGKQLATAGADGTVRIWPIAGGRPVILVGHEGPVNSAEFDHTGDRIVSAGLDGTVRIWDTAGGDTLVVLHRHRSAATGADFGPNGRSVVSAGGDGMRITPCEVCGSFTEVLRIADTRAPRMLSPSERQRLIDRGP
ncbi:MAG: TIR domain-containing protein [Solirubrobacteraceae bacterium]